MHIAVAYDCLFPYSTGGGERQYRVFAEEFAAAGHRVTYLTRQQWDGAPPGGEPFDIKVISTDRELYDETGARTLGPAIRFARGLYRHLRRHRDYDAVLVSAIPATNVPAARAALIGSPAVLVVDWLEVWRPAQWREYKGPVAGRVATAIQRIAVRFSPIASCHSQLNARRLTELGLRSEPVVSPGLIDGQCGGRPVLTATEPPRVIYVGRHIPDKRVETLPAAIAVARDRIPELTATIYGEGRSRAAVRAEIARLGLGAVIDTPGFVSQEELDEGMRTAACLVNPSAREGYGLVVVEACAQGTPVVLVEGPDNAALELVADGVNGRIAGSVAAPVLGNAIADVVAAGPALRKSTAEWFQQASRTRTIRAAATQLLGRIQAAVSSGKR
ncbi:MAG TPA: glycosyltransferase family 4 protein [Actinophytocola sp.]|uniref:glycosyltransferase family 4 protein n=1 Tax=Actinophytocola sp. TaxID=1872138 RepID=UPI002DBB4F67|nr:glycosyltransferase family 4 protein [Actinophytocola sp.]HEU5473260.1 glycosyltransferase family 4 protein [Actinophytocola sp.]